MPLPFILGAAAIAAASYGAKKGYDGYQTKSEADDIIDKCKTGHEKAKKVFDNQNSATEQSLEKLGKFQLDIGQSFAEFNTLAEELLAKLNKSIDSKLFEVNVPKHKLAEIKRFELSTTAYIAKLGGAGVAGAAAAYAVYGGVMALGAASTGTAISALSGAAAYNAAMAAIGGGSLAAGGFGMAGGAAILGATVAAPILAVAGWAYNSHAEDALKDAKKAEKEARQAIQKMDYAVSQLKRVDAYAVKINTNLTSIYEVFTRYFEALKAMDVVIKMGDESLIDAMSEKLMLTINNGYSVAAILTDVITTPLFKVKVDGAGEPIIKDGMAEFATDEQGMQVLNLKIPDVLNKANDDILAFKA